MHANGREDNFYEDTNTAVEEHITHNLPYANGREDNYYEDTNTVVECIAHSLPSPTKKSSVMRGIVLWQVYRIAGFNGGRRQAHKGFVKFQSIFMMIQAWSPPPSYGGSEVWVGERIWGWRGIPCGEGSHPWVPCAHRVGIVLPPTCTGWGNRECSGALHLKPSYGL